MYLDRVRRQARDYITDDILDEIVDDIYENDIIHRNPDYYATSLDETLDNVEFYDVRTAVEVLEELDRWEETDMGLVAEKAGWRDIVRTFAYYTYRNAVAQYIDKAFNEIECIELDEVKSQFKSEPSEEELKEAIAEAVRQAIVTV